MADGVSYRFSAEKNALLMAERGIGFDDVLYALENDKLLDTINHTSPKHPHQRMYVVEIDGYAYVVPFVETKGKIFLKTVYPSSRMTKRYLKQENL